MKQAGGKKSCISLTPNKNFIFILAFLLINSETLKVSTELYFRDTGYPRFSPDPGIRDFASVFKSISHTNTAKHIWILFDERTMSRRSSIPQWHPKFDWIFTFSFNPIPALSAIFGLNIRFFFLIWHQLNSGFTGFVLIRSGISGKESGTPNPETHMIFIVVCFIFEIHQSRDGIIEF